MSTIVFSRQWTDVANRALSLISKDSVESLDDVSDPKLSYQLNRLLPEAVTHVLGERPWRSMAKETQLSPSSGAVSLDGLYNLFPLPSDVVQVIPALSDSGWIRKGNSLLSANDTINITYVPLPMDPSTIPHLILNAIVSYLAYLLAVPAGCGSDTRTLMLSQYALDIKSAADAEGDGSYAKPDATGWWTEER